MIRVRVGHDHLSNGVSVAVTQQEEGGHGKHILHFGPFGEHRWEQLTAGASVEPTFALDDEVAVLLMNALVSHYQGVDDQRALRKDYDDERRRVDKLTDALVGIVQKATGA